MVGVGWGLKDAYDSRNVVRSYAVGIDDVEGCQSRRSCIIDEYTLIYTLVMYSQLFL